MIYDFDCNKCGFSITDHIVLKNDESVTCLMCGEIMIKRFPVVNFKIINSNNKLPDNYKPHGGANFGRL